MRCQNLPSIWQKLKKVIGVFTVKDADSTMVVSAQGKEELAACMSRLQQVQALAWQFKQAIDHITEAHVSFNDTHKDHIWQEV